MVTNDSHNRSCITISVGVAYYLITGVLYYFSHHHLARVLLVASAVGSLLLSGYLAYVMTAVINRLCLACSFMYVSNILILLGTVLDVHSEGGPTPTLSLRPHTDRIQASKRASSR